MNGSPTSRDTDWSNRSLERCLTSPFRKSLAFCHEQLIRSHALKDNAFTKSDLRNDKQAELIGTRTEGQQTKR
jgi:hypothetical protein